jgi:Cft2 family RNA processing exonuclease
VAELTFSGAAGTVTGSKHLLATGGKHLFIDCRRRRSMPSC